MCRPFQSDGARHIHSREDRPCVQRFQAEGYPRAEEIATIEVRTEQLDDCLPVGYVPHLIKIDVEGPEQQVLEGAVGTIRLHKPIVIFEHGRGSAEYYGTSPSDVFDLLSGKAGLRIFDVDGRGPLDLSEFERTFQSGSVWNFVAHA